MAHTNSRFWLACVVGLPHTHPRLDSSATPPHTQQGHCDRAGRTGWRTWPAQYVASTRSMMWEPTLLPSHFPHPTPPRSRVLHRAHGSDSVFPRPMPAGYDTRCPTRLLQQKAGDSFFGSLGTASHDARASSKSCAALPTISSPTPHFMPFWDW